MSSTRHAPPGEPMKQNRYASSVELETGLLASMVSIRCSVLSRAEDRDLIWFIQHLSHQDGGLKQLATELCKRFPERMATPAMQRLGMKPGQIYNASQVKQVRSEIPNGDSDFALEGEIAPADLFFVPDAPSDPVARYTSNWEHERDAAVATAERNASQLPKSYEAGRFIAHCRDAASEHLERQLQELCLDPAIKSLADGSPWYFPTLVSTLREYQADWIAARKPAFVTSVGRQVFEVLDYALARRLLVLIDGDTRMGKSHAVQDWISQHPGQARYVQVPNTNDEIGFFREIAKALGLSSGQGWKAVQLRERIKDVLQTGDLLLILDEAHFCLPTNGYRHALPKRIDWIRTALVDHGVGVALVTTPQFMQTQKLVEKNTGWNSAQFTGRIALYKRLPNTLPRNELEGVARVRLPGASRDAIEALVIYASNSQKYLGGIKAVADRVLYELEKAGRTKVELLDVMRAIDESVIPSDAAFAEAMNATARPARKRIVNTEPPAPARRNVVPSVSQSLPGRGVRPVVEEGNRLETQPA